MRRADQAWVVGLVLGADRCGLSRVPRPWFDAREPAEAEARGVRGAGVCVTPGMSGVCGVPGCAAAFARALAGGAAAGTSA